MVSRRSVRICLALLLYALCGFGAAESTIVPMDPTDVGYFAQLSDIHYDPHYTLNSSVTCEFQQLGGTCCRGAPQPSHGARRWGEYTCDSPGSLVNLTLDWLKHLHDHETPLDFILWTGDTVDHHDFNQTLRDNIISLETVTSWLADRFYPNDHPHPPPASGEQAQRANSFVPLFPLLGNHDTWPIDQLCPYPLNDGSPRETIGSLYKPLYDSLLKSWGGWLQASGADVEALSMLHAGGFYWLQVAPGLRLFALNTLFYDSYNVLMTANLCNESFPNEMDIGDGETKTRVGSDVQWQTLLQFLHVAREEQQRVYLVGHIPPGCSEASSWFSHKFQLLASEFQDVISATFWGHRHTDSFFLSRQTATEGGAAAKVVAHGYIAPSVLPQQHFPSVRVYQYNRTTFEILDYQQYAVNLTELNNNSNNKDNNAPGGARSTGFELVYSAKQEYGLADLSIQSWSGLADRILRDPDVFSLFWSHYYEGVEHQNCDARCKRDLWCDIEFITQEDNHACKNETLFFA